MTNPWLQGFVLGLAYLAPIGMQNLFVINTAAQGNARRTALVAVATIISDVSLAAACFFGVGLALDAFPTVRRIVLLAGSVAVLLIGLSLIRSALRSNGDASRLVKVTPDSSPSGHCTRPDARSNAGASSATPSGGPITGGAARLIASSFAVTWLNPQAVIDGSLLLGGYRASLDADASVRFILGVCLASATWFSFLSISVAALRARISPHIARVINLVSGAALALYGVRLGLSLLK